MPEDKFSEPQDEPLFMALHKDDHELQKCAEQAQGSLDLFLNLHEQYGTRFDVYFAIKVLVTDGDERAHLWYSFQGMSDGLLLGKHYQLPPELEEHATVAVRREDIEDWMINDHQVLYGGFSIRYQRSNLPEEERRSFDEHIGVKEYKNLN